MEIAMDLRMVRDRREWSARCGLGLERWLIWCCSV
jgi:hypothetical protein